jgi:hypothetical protein
VLCRSEEFPAQLRYIRAYGADNEMLPPVVLLRELGEKTQIGSAYATVEFDVKSGTIPNTYVRLVHCNADWTEDENGFLNDVTNRSSLVEWGVASSRSVYHSYRGKVRIPNVQLSLRFAGNWKVLVYDMDGDRLLGEARIFVVNPEAQSILNFMTDFYEPKSRVSSIALTLENVVGSPSTKIIDPNVHTTVFYRNHRWFEPFICSNRRMEWDNLYDVGTRIDGVYPAGKVFRISRIPAQNEYRVLDLTNQALFPSTGAPVRLPLSDLRRNGMFLQRSDDGALITTMVSSSSDEYVPVEFVLDPNPGSPSRNDVFVVGSFNNWMPTRDCMMWYDEELNLYRLRQWLRRGRHNYLYATGTLNVDNGQIPDLSFEEFEGNTASNSNSYLAFTYARIIEYGGYDAIIAVGASNIYQGYR